MPNDINQVEEERKGKLNQARKAAILANDVFNATHADPRAIMSLTKKFGKYWPVFIMAAIFDLFALIPFLSVVFNLCFGGVMFLYFGKKKVVSGIVAPIVIGSIFDFFLSLLPINLAAATIRIALKETVG
mgnify:CR=1 FL=1